MQVCTSLQTDIHASTSPLSFLQARCPSCRPTNSVKALKAASSFHATNNKHSSQLKQVAAVASGHITVATEQGRVTA